MPPRKPAQRKRKASSPPPAVERTKKIEAAQATSNTTSASKPGITKGSTKKKPAAMTPQPTPQLDNTLAAFKGKFDAYSTALPFINKFYHPSGSSQPDYKATYNAILPWQAKPDYTMRVALDGSSAGRLECRTICNPFDDEPLSPIAIESGKVSSSMKLDAGQTGEPLVFTQSGAGYVASFNFESEDCFDISGTGRFTLRHVWQGDN
ncbi:hypothetical protein EXIGLDRAFT_847968, partial [Exidia glandulosa HHB12029]